MICLSDSDLILHLAAWDLYKPFLELIREFFGVGPDKIFVIDGFVRLLEIGESEMNPIYEGLKSQYGKPALDRALVFCKTLQRVYSLPHDRQIVIDLDDVDDIDEGEAVLIAVAIHHPQSIILTNEVKCLTALASGGSICEPLFAKLKGRVFHLRQIIYCLLQRSAFSKMQPRIAAVKDGDGYISKAFSYNAQGCQAYLINGISSVQGLSRDILYTVP